MHRLAPCGARVARPIGDTAVIKRSTRDFDEITCRRCRRTAAAMTGVVVTKTAAAVQRLALAILDAVAKHGTPNTLYLTELHREHRGPVPSLAGRLMRHHARHVEAELRDRGATLVIRLARRRGEVPTGIVVTDRAITAA